MCHVCHNKRVPEVLLPGGRDYVVNAYTVRVVRYIHQSFRNVIHTSIFNSVISHHKRVWSKYLFIILIFMTETKQ